MKWWWIPFVHLSCPTFPSGTKYCNVCSLIYSSFVRALWPGGESESRAKPSLISSRMPGHQSSMVPSALTECCAVWGGSGQVCFFFYSAVIPQEADPSCCSALHLGDKQHKKSPVSLLGRKPWYRKREDARGHLDRYCTRWRSISASFCAGIARGQ